MFAIRVKKAVLEGGKMMRSHVDVFGLLECVGSMKLTDVRFKLEAISLMRLDGGPDHSATS